MSQEKKPSEKIVKNPIDGMEIVDAIGRVIRLRKPDILDQYDLFSAIGDDVKNPACFATAIKVIHIATIDGQVVESPKSLAQFRATLKRIGTDGMNAVDRAFDLLDDSQTTEKELLEKIKK